MSTLLPDLITIKFSTFPIKSFARTAFTTCYLQCLIKIHQKRWQIPRPKVNMGSRRLNKYRIFTRNTTHPLILEYILQSISKTSTGFDISKGVGIITITIFLLLNTVKGDKSKTVTPRVMVMVSTSCKILHNIINISQMVVQL